MNYQPLRYLVFLLAFFAIVLLGACRGEDVAPDELVLTQQQLDAAALVFRASDLNVTGAPFGHRENDSTRFLIRDISSNVPAGQSLQPGSIIAIRAYRKTAAGKGTLKLIDVMVKHDKGYNPGGADFEYLRIPFDPATDYTQHPNGLLPTLLQTDRRGKDLVISPESCVTCHHKSPNRSFIFSRNF
jgi:hypothetical protein